MNSQAVAEAVHATAELQQRLRPPIGHALEALDEDPGRLPPLADDDVALDPDDIEADLDREFGIEPAPPQRRRGRPRTGHRIARADEAAAKRNEAVRNNEVRRAQEARERALVATVRTYLADHPEGVTAGDVSRDLGENVYMAAKALAALQLTREVVRRENAQNRTIWRLAQPGELPPAPAVKTLEVPTFDRVSYGEAIAQIFDSGASYHVDELVKRSRQQWPQSDTELATAAINVLLDQGRIERLQLGSQTRYRKVARAEQSA